MEILECRKMLIAETIDPRNEGWCELIPKLEEGLDEIHIFSLNDDWTIKFGIKLPQN